VNLHLTLFVAQNLLFILFLILQITYQQTLKPQLFKVAEGFHIAAALQTDILQLYVASVLVKLSEPETKRRNQILNRDVSLLP
jgi:hypothetical protein